MMRYKFPRFKALSLIAIASAISFSFIYAIPSSRKEAKHNLVSVAEKINRAEKNIHLYDSLNLDSLSLSKEAFLYAVHGLDSLRAAGVVKNDSIISIADYSLSSCKKRLFVINLSTGELLFNSLVSHGRNSGKEIATRFSNKLNSFETSLGFYVTGDTYKGEHGYSLRLQGLEKGINDNAFNRGIVMHSASYVNESLVRSQGYIGRSLGCPAVPESLHKAIIQTIKGGSCFFAYSPDKKYIAHTKMLKSPFEFVTADSPV